jgi:hypothetical protein
MDSRIFFLLTGCKAPNIPPETIAQDFIFRGNRRQQEALWRELGADLMQRYPGRKLWAYERFGKPGP